MQDSSRITGYMMPQLRYNNGSIGGLLPYRIVIIIMLDSVTNDTIDNRIECLFV